MASFEHQPLPPWRSILFVPAHQQRFIAAAHQRGADAIQLDLEDSVPQDSKALARQQLPEVIAQLLQHNVDVLVRVNRELRDSVLDLESAVIAGVRAITLPKVMGAEHIALIDEVITAIERERSLPLGGIKLIALIETIEGLLNSQAIAGASPRLAALAFGSEDFSLDAGIEPTEKNLFAPCQQLVMAARHAEIAALGFPGSIAEYSQPAALGCLIRNAKAMGFNGTFCIHPKQIEPINQAFSLTETELNQAYKIITAYEEVMATQQGAAVVDGQMVDLPVVMRAREVLARYANQSQR